MPAAISPVYAPYLCSLIFCAPSRMLESRMALETSLKAVNGGQTTMSTSLTPFSPRLMPATRSSASATVLFIFQLPAMISLRSLTTVRNETLGIEQEKPRSSADWLRASHNRFDPLNDDIFTC